MKKNNLHKITILLKKFSFIHIIYAMLLLGKCK